ncbi:ankyrin repeat and death domain-containing protein 1A-like isoform X3 [Anthonomus grandis grandis]|uniref:ankyrin repeat and death domain-containing protein 1A-like isoform X3 n=1 Tax=Anthonomus grandis grandis TaxID=2921223 RepID=UPI0021662330|nr:ankyrin repeat and death domain-containing protein 1A-like isoform X3 [Anthonomus grandis grandis]
MPSHVQYISCPNRTMSASPTSTPEELERRALIQRNDLLLHEAVIKNDAEGVRRILREPVDINSRNNYGRAPIHWASARGNIEIMDMLLKAHCDVEARDKENKTPLHEACQGGHAEVAQLLLAREADMESRDSSENTPLHLAAQHQQNRLVQILLDHGADPDSENQKGNTALHIAASLGSKGILECLLQHGASLSVQNQCGNTALHMASQSNEPEIVQMLINKGANLNCLNKRLQTPIHIAAEMGHTEVCKLLLGAGADIEQREQGGRTPLYVAARGSFTAIVDMIIKTARLDYPSHDESTDLKKETASLRPKLSRRWRSASKDETRAKEYERLKEVLYKLAYKHLGPGEWKKLAYHWSFTEDQIKAIEHQYNGPSSYKEHGFRMMLIWAHGLNADTNPIKELYESLVAVGKRPLADTMRKKIDQENETRRRGQTKRKCSRCSIC